MGKPILFFISHGHGTGTDRGAVSGKFVELELNKKVAMYCYKYMMKTPKAERKWRVDYTERNASGYSLVAQAGKIVDYQSRYRTVAIDIHFNAGGGDGAEVWITSKNGERKRLGEKLGNKILSEFKEAGQNSRGVKTTNDLYFVNNPNKGVAVLVECGFIDNKTDRKGFDTEKELKAYGEAIGKALVWYANRYE